MAPLQQSTPSWTGIPKSLYAREKPDHGWRRPGTAQEVLIVESWSEGVMLGSLMIMAAITLANMRKRVWLHKFILIELLLALTHGTFCFFNFEGYGWYLSSTAMLLYFSYWLHNIVAWMKIKPFLSKNWSWFYVGTVCLSLPVICFQISNNFRYFNNISNRYLDVRPYEPLFRDPWWVMTTVYLVIVIHKTYNIPMLLLFKRAPRFGIMLVSMLFSIIFIVVDVVSSIVPNFSSTVGINPYWKFALIFKCFCDTIILDDFKTALEKLRRGVFETMETVRFDDGEDAGLGRQRRNAVDRSSHRIFNRVRTMSIPISPTANRDPSHRKSWAQRFSDSSQDPDAAHVEHTDVSHETSRSSRFTLDDDIVKEETEVEPQTRHNRAEQARERIGKVGMKLAKLPSLAVFRSPLKRERDVEENRNSSTSPRQESHDFLRPEMAQRSLHRMSTRFSNRSGSSHQLQPNRRSIPDPYHIPTDNELDSDPTGRRTFEERRRIITTRDDSTPIAAATAWSINPPHPGEPWGDFEGEEFDEPWGVNVAAATKRRISEQAEARDRQRSRTPSDQSPTKSPEREVEDSGLYGKDSGSESNKLAPKGRPSTSSERRSEPKISFSDT